MEYFVLCLAHSTVAYGVLSTDGDFWLDCRHQAPENGHNPTCLRAGARGISLPTTAAAAQGTHSGVLRTIGGQQQPLQSYIMRTLISSIPSVKRRYTW